MVTLTKSPGRRSVLEEVLSDANIFFPAAPSATSGAILVILPSTITSLSSNSKLTCTGRPINSKFSSIILLKSLFDNKNETSNAIGSIKTPRRSPTVTKRPCKADTLDIMALNGA